MTDADMELIDVWRTMHELVRCTRNLSELRCPRVYKEYERLCQFYGEPIQEATVLDDGLPGEVI